MVSPKWSFNIPTFFKDTSPLKIPAGPKKPKVGRSGTLPSTHFFRWKKCHFYGRLFNFNRYHLRQAINSHRRTPTSCRQDTLKVKLHRLLLLQSPLIDPHVGILTLTGWWLEPTHLKCISQIGNLPQIGVKIKNI